MLLVVVPLLVGSAGLSCAPASGTSTLTGPGVSVATWNVCGSSCGNWKKRSEYVTAQVARTLPDVVAIQEGTWGKKKRVHTFGGFKKIGYATANQKKPFIGRYTFYRPDKVSALGAGSFSLGGTHGMSWTKFKTKATGEKFTVVNVHLTYPKGANSERASQMRRGMAKLAAQTKGVPVIWAGDFNSNKSRRDDAPARIMKASGHVDSRSIAATKVNANVNSARGRSATAPVNRDSNQTDHIYVTKAGAQVSEWRQYVNATKSRYLAPFVSDHNMIAISVAFGADPAPASAEIEPEAADVEPAEVESDPASAPSKKVPGYNTEQLRNAGAIIAQGKTMGVPERGQVIAIMTAIGESTLRVLDRGDAAGPDSRGLFQQRANGAWGSLADRMDPAKSAGSFYRVLLKVKDWQELEPTAAAHRVQRNADPNHYTRYWADAKKIYSAVSGTDLDAVSASTSTGCTEGDTQQASYGATADCDFKGYKNPNSCTEALAKASNIATSSACKSDLAGGNWRRWCLAFVARAYGRQFANYATAMDMYRAMDRRGLISKSKDIPAGALVFFSASSSAGHVALYNGDGKAWSNDYIRSGCIDLTPMSKMGAGGRYLGWSPPAFPGS